MAHLIMGFSGEPVRTCDKGVVLLPGTSAGDGIRLPRYCKTDGILQIPAKLKPYCIRVNLMEVRLRAATALHCRHINRELPWINPIGIKKCIQIPRCAHLRAKSARVAAQIGSITEYYAMPMYC